MSVTGERIKEARIDKRMSQKHLADAISRRQATISAIERGESSPSNESIKKIAEVLGVSVSYLLGEGSMKFVERMNGRVFQSEYESPIEPTPNKPSGEKVVLEKNGSRAEFPQGTSPEYISEVLKILWSDTV